jgi:hypothetical protein
MYCFKGKGLESNLYCSLFHRASVRFNKKKQLKVFFYRIKFRGCYFIMGTIVILVTATFPLLPYLGTYKPLLAFLDTLYLEYALSLDLQWAQSFNRQKGEFN